MKRSVRRLLLSTLIFFVGTGVSSCTHKKDTPKFIHAGGDLTPKQAYKMLMEDAEHTFLIDCRFMAEYEFLGHPPMAYNIPYQFWSPKRREKNPDFVQDVEEKFKKTDTLLIICRSGRRSCLACDKLALAGFKHIFNVLGGFEGEKVENKNSPHYGHRRYINGWQRDGLPYTYKLEKKLVYKLHKSCGCD